MIHGRGNQYKLTKTYQKDREEGLKDSFDLTDEEKSDLDISGSDGQGRTNPDTYKRDVQGIRIEGKQYSSKEYDKRSRPEICW